MHSQAQFTCPLFSLLIGLIWHFSLKKDPNGEVILDRLYYKLNFQLNWMSSFYLKNFPHGTKLSQTVQCIQCLYHINSNLNLANIKWPERFMWICICRQMHITIFGLQILTCSICTRIEQIIAFHILVKAKLSFVISDTMLSEAISKVTFTFFAL